MGSLLDSCLLTMALLSSFHFYTAASVTHIHTLSLSHTHICTHRHIYTYLHINQNMALAAKGSNDCLSLVLNLSSLYWFVKHRNLWGISWSLLTSFLCFGHWSSVILAFICSTKLDKPCPCLFPFFPTAAISSWTYFLHTFRWLAPKCSLFLKISLIVSVVTFLMPQFQAFQSISRISVLFSYKHLLSKYFWLYYYLSSKIVYSATTLSVWWW